MPVEFLTDAHLERYGRFQSDPTPFQLAEYFVLTPQPAATFPAGHRPKGGMLAGFAFPGHHSIDYGCTVVGIVFSVNPLNGAV